MQKRGLVVLALVLTPAVALARDTRCMSSGKFYKSGAVRCNEKGTQDRCVDGSWKPLGLDCADEGAGDAGKREQPAVEDDAVDAPAPPAVPPVNRPRP